MRFAIRIQKTKDDAARLRALMYQTKAGVSIRRITRANVGNATAAGVTGKTALAIVNDMCLVSGVDAVGERLNMLIIRK